MMDSDQQCFLPYECVSFCFDFRVRIGGVEKKKMGTGSKGYFLLFKEFFSSAVYVKHWLLHIEPT